MAARTARFRVTFRQVESLRWLNELVAQAVSHYANDHGDASGGLRGSATGVPAGNRPRVQATDSGSRQRPADPATAQPADVALGEEVSVVAALATETDDALAHLRTGEATSVVLLTATALGLASCPVSEPLETAATRERIRAELFGHDRYPQMLLRFGWAPINADPLPPAPRHPLAEVATRMDGSPFSIS
jgi:hypothetical protein